MARSRLTILFGLAALTGLLYLSHLAVSVQTGLLAYHNSTPNPLSPKYRAFNGTNFSLPANANETSNSTSWTVLKSNHRRNESVMVGITGNSTNSFIFGQVWNGTNWGNYINFTTTLAQNERATKRFDLSFEWDSGNAMVVFDNSTGLAYNIWNGTDWNFSQGSDLPASCPGRGFWIETSSQNNSNEILLGRNNQTGLVCAVIWNGTAWNVSSARHFPSRAAPGSRNFDVAYEMISGDGLLAYESTTAGVMASCSWSGLSWCSAVTSLADVGAANTNLSLVSQPGGNKIMLLSIEPGQSDVHRFEWSGSGWGSDGNDPSATVSGAMAIDAVYINSTSALIVYVDSTANPNSPAFVVCNDAQCTGTTWGTIAYVTTSTCGETSSLDFIELEKDPYSQNITLVVSSQANSFKCFARFSPHSWDASLYTKTLGQGYTNPRSKNFDFTFDSYIDSQAPVLVSQEQNISNPAVNSTALLSALWSDDNNLAWAVLETNETGEFQNKTSPIQLLGRRAWSNFTWSNTSVPGGQTVFWRVWANDSSGNLTGSPLMSFTVTQPVLEVYLVTPDPAAPTNVLQNSTFLVNATVTCRQAHCGNVNATINYNSTSQDPDTQVPSESGSPFHIISGQFQSQACPGNPLDQDESCNITWNLNATGAPGTNWKIGARFNSTSSQNFTLNSTLSITSCLEIIDLQFSGIIFPNINPNTLGNEAEGNSNLLYNITLNSGGCPMDLYIKGEDMTSNFTDRRILLANLSYNNFTNDYPSSLRMNYQFSQDNSSARKGITSLQNVTLYFFLDIPPIPATTYNGTFTFCANSTSLCF